MGGGLRDAGAPVNVRNPAPLQDPAQSLAEQRTPSYAGVPRDAQLEYRAILANASIGIAFTRGRKFFLCNPKFAAMFGWQTEELVGQPGEAVYPSRESYEALGAIAIPILGAGGQLDIEWEMRRRDGSTFLCHIVAKAVSESSPQAGTVWIAEDVTERRRHADEVARLAREQEAILDTASIGICFVKDRHIVRCNRRMEQMYGYAPGELNGKPTAVTYAEGADQAKVPEWYAQMARGETHSHVLPARRKDGSVFWERASGRAMDPADPAKGAVWLLEDITDQRRAEEELQRVLAEQRALIDNVVVGIAIVRERKFARCNRRFEELFGYAGGEALGLSVREVYFTEAEFEAGGATYAELDAGRTHTREQWLRRRDGSGFWCRLSGRAIEPGNPAKGYVWLFEDFSERKRADEEIRRMVREQDAVLQNALIGIAFIRDRRVVRCNHRFEEIFGYAQGELLGRSTRFMFASDTEFEAGGDPLYEAVWRGETQSIERAHLREDGTRIWCSISGRAVQPGDPSQGSVWLFEDITQEHAAEERVRHALAEQELILDNAAVGIAFVRNRVIQRCNRFLEQMVGAEPGTLVGKTSGVLFYSEADWLESGRLAYGQTAPGQTHDSEWRFRRSDGSGFVCRTRGRRIDAGSGEQEWIWSFEDVTLEREAEARIQRALAEQELILDNATLGIAFVRHRAFQRCNPRLEEMFGYAPGELSGRSTEALFASRQEFEAVGAEMYPRLAGGASHVEERRLRRKDDTPIWCKVVVKAADPERAEEGAIAIYDDITAEHAARESLEASRDALERAVAERTRELVAANRQLEAEIRERKQAESRAQHLADHDALTGLPNRRLLEDRLTQAIARSARNRKPIAVMFVDLDRFKHVNDTLGHAVGDAVLKEIGDRLVRQLRLADTICRMGGDEFVVVLPEIKRSSDAAGVAQKVIELASQPVTVQDHELLVSASVGISVYPEDGRDAETLIRNADAAMYHAKETGRAGYQFFTAEMNVTASRRVALESELRRAVQDEALRVFYQPVVDARTGATVSYEALLRWQHPARGLVPPLEFLQLAEDTGLILRIGDWVLREACRRVARMDAAHALPVSVNLSAREFADPKLAELVARALADAGVSPKLLALEVSEATVMQHADISLAVLAKLRALGVAVTLDDFGTGFSNLAQLRRLALERLNVDRALVAALPADRDAATVVSAIVGLGHALGLRVLAAGVETEAQRDFLKACGCDLMQGYLFGAPAAAG